MSPPMDPRAEKKVCYSLGALEYTRSQKVEADKVQDRERAVKNKELDDEDRRAHEAILHLLRNEELREIEDKQRSLTECKEKRINLSSRIETLLHDIASLEEELRSKQAELATLETDNPSSATDGSPIDALRGHFDLKRREKEQLFKQTTLSRQQEAAALNRRLELEREEDEENYNKERKQLLDAIAKIRAGINDPSSQELKSRELSAELDPLEVEQEVIRPDHASENMQPAHPPPLAPMNLADTPSVSRAMSQKSDSSVYPTTDTVCDVGFELLDAIAIPSLPNSDSPPIANAVQQRNQFVENEDATDTRSPTVQLLNEARLSLRPREDAIPEALVENHMAEAESDSDIEDIPWPTVSKENVSHFPTGTYRNHISDRINLRLNKLDGSYIDPEYVAGVPVSKLSESDPYWIKSWSTQQDLLSTEDRHIAKESKIITRLEKEYADALDGLGDISQTERPEDYKTHTGKCREIGEELERKKQKRKKNKTNLETSKGLCRWLDTQSSHPNQVLAPQYLHSSGLLNRRHLSKYREIMSILTDAKSAGFLKQEPLLWLRAVLIHQIKSDESTGSQRKTVNEMLMTLMTQPRFKDIQSAGVESDSLIHADGASNEDEVIPTVAQHLGDPADEEVSSPAEQIDLSNEAATPLPRPKRTLSGNDSGHPARKARKTDNGFTPVNITPIKARPFDYTPQLLTPTSAKSITVIDLTTADSGSQENTSPQLTKRGRPSSKIVNTSIAAVGVGNTPTTLNLVSLTTIRHKKPLRIKDNDDPTGLVILRYDTEGKTFKAWSSGPGRHPLTLWKVRKFEDVVIKVEQIKQVIRVGRLVEISWRLKKDEGQPMLLEFQVDFHAKDFVRLVRTLNPDICKEENLPTEKALQKRYDLPLRTGGRTGADSSPKTSNAALRRVDLNKQRVQQKKQGPESPAFGY